MIRYGLFCYGSFAYAVPLLSMRKIVHQRRGYLLPMLPKVVAEILVDDGRLVPVVELSQITDRQEMSACSANYKVLASSVAGTVAFPAEVTCGIVAAQKGQLLPTKGAGMTGITGVFGYQGKEYNILDVDYLAMAMTEEVAQ
nr:chemotaxis protein CheW [Malonomonas rubra]